MSNKYPNYKTVGYDIPCGKFTLTNDGAGGVVVDNRETCESKVIPVDELEKALSLVFHLRRNGS